MPAIQVDRILNFENVLGYLGELLPCMPLPDYIRSDNSPEFIVKVVRGWLEGVGVKTLTIEPGRTRESGYNESSDGKLRVEFLNSEDFYPLKKTNILIDRSRHHYKLLRSHSALDYQPPTLQMNLYHKMLGIVVQSALLLAQ